MQMSGTFVVGCSVHAQEWSREDRWVYLWVYAERVEYMGHMI